jgi:uncharacterized protein YdiU (UPF0061 family)
MNHFVVSDILLELFAMDEFINFQNTFSSLPSEFYQNISPAPVSQPQLIAWNRDLADFLGIAENLSEVEQTLVFSGNKVAETSIPLASAYSGHQFGGFNPGLGDGRAHLLGELRGKDGILYDVQLKGSGRTNYSRSGDGRSPLGPVLREYIVSEAMHHLGIPTTRSLAAVATGESVHREALLPGGILTRTAISLIRIGHFEYFSSRGDPTNLKILLDYVVQRVYPELSGSEDLAQRFFELVVQRQADLVAQWMGLGFVHGVLNTDNCSSAGITIDYGPCAFLDETDFKKTFSSIDRRGRYAFGNQPQIIQWNLARLAEALLVLDGEDYEAPKEKYSQHIFQFTSIFENRFQQVMGQKMGLTESPDPIARRLVGVWLNYLESNKLDFTRSFRNIVTLLDPQGPQNLFPLTEEFQSFRKDWTKEINQNFPSKERAIESLYSINPLLIPRNHQIELVIQEAYQGNFDRFHRMQSAIQAPFKSIQLSEEFVQAPLESEKVYETFCGT